MGFRERLAPYIAALDHCAVLTPPVGALIGPLAVMMTGLASRETIPQIEVAVAENVTALVFRCCSRCPRAILLRCGEFAKQHGLRIYLQSGGLDSVAPARPATGE